MSLFELRTPRDMLEKTRREHARLLAHWDIDNIFNFFVTANHIRDYIQRTESVPNDVLQAFLQDPDLRDCRDLCDKGKHLVLTKREDPKTSTMSGCIGGAPIGALPLGAGTVWLLSSAGRSVDVRQLASRVMVKWDEFFEGHGL
jgi:hypothetical protein